MNTMKKRVGRKPKAALTIAVDCGSLSYKDAKHFGGIATVANNLLSTLGKIDKRNKYLLYSFAPIEDDVVRGFGHRMKNVVLPVLGYKTLWLPLALKFTKVDAFFALSQAIPWRAPPTIGFLYDLAFLEYPLAYRSKGKLTRNTDQLVAQAQHLITTSEASKRDIRRHYNLSEDRISVCYPAASNIFTPKGTKYIDTKPYFLYVGALKVTKNIPTLIEGFSKFLDSVKSEYRMVLVGTTTGLDPEIPKTLARLKMGKQVIIKGFVKTEDLPKYYRGALALVTPALFEGFGLPILEALSSGCPVIVGDNSAQPEVVGRAGIKIRADNPVALSQAMFNLAHDDKLRTKLKKLGLKQAQRFNLKQFARCVLDLLYKYHQ